MRGRKPAPTRLKIINGSRASRINQYEPVPAPVPPVCPDDAAPDVRAVWDETVRHLESMALAHGCDGPMLRAYCEAVVLHRRASAIIAADELLVAGLHVAAVRNPAVQIQRDAANIMIRFAQEFGLTPSARTRIQVGQPPDDRTGSPFAGDAS